MAADSMPGAPIRFLSTNEEYLALGDALTQNVSRCLMDSEPLNGEDVVRFENAIATVADRRHAIAVGSCTDALFFALTAAGIGPGDEVLVPAFSFLASASAIMRTGAQPVFVDIEDPRAPLISAPFTMDLSRARRALTPQTRAMLWVGLFGGLADPAPIARFAQDHDLVLVEDAAQSFGAHWGGRHAGGLGLASCFSFDRQKVLAAPGTGGAVVTDDDALADKVRSLRWHGRGAGHGDRLGYNSQLSNLFAAVLNLKLEQLPGWIERRRVIAQAYDDGLADLPVTLPQWSSEVQNARHKYVLLSDRRAALHSHLQALGIPTKRHYDKALPDEPLFACRQPPEDFPIARLAAANALSMPIHPFLSDRDVETIVKAIRDCFV